MLSISNLSDFGEQFKRERKALGKTQADVALLAGLRRETIIRIESGENIDLMTLLKAIAAINKGLQLVDKQRPAYDAIPALFNDEN